MAERKTTEYVPVCACPIEYPPNSVLMSAYFVAGQMIDSSLSSRYPGPSGTGPEARSEVYFNESVK